METKKTYFSYLELTKTSHHMFNDVTTPELCMNLARLWSWLDEVREKLGSPIYVNSAFRTPQVNKSVGGVENSFHLLACAADIRCHKSMMERLKRIVNEYDLVEFIDYGSFIHVAI